MESLRGPYVKLWKRRAWLHRSSQDGGAVTAVRFLHTAGRISPREVCVSGNKAGSVEPFRPLDIVRGTVEFGVCPTRFQSCFDPIFPHYDPIPPLWNDNVYCVHCGLEVRNLLLILHRFSIKRLPGV